MNFSYLAIKLPNFKSVDEKLPELEPRMSHSFDIEIVSRTKILKVLESPQAHSRWNFSVSKWDITIFFAILKLYLWSICMANNLILAISFGFKLNSNLNSFSSGNTSGISKIFLKYTPRKLAELRKPEMTAQIVDQKFNRGCAINVPTFEQLGLLANIFFDRKSLKW